MGAWDDIHPWVAWRYARSMAGKFSYTASGGRGRNAFVPSAGPLRLAL